MFSFRNFYLRIFLLKRAELRIVLLFLGPDTGFRLIFTSTLDKLLFLPSFDEAQDKAIQIAKSKTSFKL